MGVIPCDRSNCEHIMCDRSSYTYGRICNYCFDELVKLGPKTNIDEFMNSSPSKNPFDENASYAYFNEIFKSRHEE